MRCPNCRTDRPNDVTYCENCDSFYNKIARGPEGEHYVLMARNAAIYVDGEMTRDVTQDFAFAPDGRFFWHGFAGKLEVRAPGSAEFQLYATGVSKFWVHGNRVYVLRRDAESWRVELDGNPAWTANVSDFAVCHNGALFFLGTDGNLERSPGLNQPWQQVAGTYSVLATTTDGYVFALAKSGQLKRQSIDTDTWEIQADSGVCQLVQRGSDAYWLMSDGRMFRNTSAATMGCTLRELSGLSADWINIQSEVREGDPPLDQDATPTLQRVVRRHQNRVIFFPSGTYTIRETVFFPSYTTLVGPGDGSAIIKSAPTLAAGHGMLWTENEESTDSDGKKWRMWTQRILIQGLTFDQSDEPSGQLRDALTLELANDVLIVNCIFTGGPRRGGDSHLGPSQSTRVRIADCLFENACDEGIYINGRGTVGFVVENCAFVGCGSDPSRPAGHGYCVGIKRGAELAFLHKNMFFDALYGVVCDTGSASGEPDAVSGAHNVIIGNLFRRIWNGNGFGEGSVERTNDLSNDPTFGTLIRVYKRTSGTARIFVFLMGDGTVFQGTSRDPIALRCRDVAVKPDGTLFILTMDRTLKSQSFGSSEWTVRGSFEAMGVSAEGDVVAENRNGDAEKF